MEATDTTLWTLIPYLHVNHGSAQRNIFLPKRYCRCCLRDNAEAAQSRRDLHKKTDCSSSDGDGSSEGEPCDLHKDTDCSSSDEDGSFCDGPGTPCFFWSDRYARDEVSYQLMWWDRAYEAMEGISNPGCEIVQHERRVMQEWCASHGITASRWSYDEFLEKTLPVSFLQLRRAGITIQYTRAKHYDSAFYSRWLRNLQVALSSWDGATVPDLLKDAFQQHPHMESASRAILSHACAGNVDLRPEEFRGNSRFEKDYTRKLLQDEIDFMEADVMAYDFKTVYMPYEYHFREYPMHEMMNDHMEYVRRPRSRLQRKVYVLFVLHSRGRRNLWMVGSANMQSFAFAVLCLRVKSVAIKHGLGNFSKGVFAHRIEQENGLTLICKATSHLFHSVRKNIHYRTK